MFEGSSIVSDKSLRILPVLLSIGLLAGCTSTDTDNVLNPNIQPPAGNAAATQVVQGACPRVELREGTAYHTVYAKGGDKDPEKIIHQASITGTTRQCQIVGDQMIMTVVASGRLVAGPSGGPGEVKLPVRVVVVNGEEVVYSELTEQRVLLPGGTPTTQFVFTNSAVAFPASASRTAKAFVGFDPGPYNTP